MRRNGNTPYVLEDREAGDRRLPTQEEASVEPTEIVDSTEDIIRELIAPEKLSAKAITKLAEFFQRKNTEEEVSEVKKKVLLIIKHLRPRPAELIDRWAFNYVMGDPVVQGLPQSIVAEMIGAERSVTHYAVKKWEKLLGWKVGSFRSQGMHLRARTLRRREHAA
jgi:hypothetical protein